MCKCLYCYQPLQDGQKDYHPACAKKIFGNTTAPRLPYSRSNIADLALQVIKSQTTVTGVQAKLSLDIDKGGKDEPDRLTLVDCGGAISSNPNPTSTPGYPKMKTLPCIWPL